MGMKFVAPVIAFSEGKLPGEKNVVSVEKPTSILFAEEE